MPFGCIPKEHEAARRAAILKGGPYQDHVPLVQEPTSDRLEGAYARGHFIDLAGSDRRLVPWDAHCRTDDHGKGGR